MWDEWYSVHTMSINEFAKTTSTKFAPLPVRPIHCKFCDVECDNAAQMQDHLDREHAGWTERVFKLMKPPQ
jgi:hypothetical protein